MKELFKNCPIPEDELLSNLGLFMPKKSLARLLYMHEIYKKILDVPGVIMEFGTRWGHNLALFEGFREIYEPHNTTRKIIGFDTFKGFPDVICEKDGNKHSVGDYSVTENYRTYLIHLMAIREKEEPWLFEVIEGDVSKEIKKYLDNHPETIIALAHFDLDLYQPTRACVDAIKRYLIKGSILSFDELNAPRFPGETIAFKELFELYKSVPPFIPYRLIHTTYSSSRSYLVIE